jgi:arsenite methyltransferase
MKTDDQIRTEVRDHYSNIARAQTGCCAPVATTHAERTHISRALGYTDEDMRAVPEAANLGLGCGNPQAIAELRAGEVVVDLGAGGGFDAFLAARAVGPTGKVIGVDMSADMVALARENARKQRANEDLDIDFRLGEIEHLPVADASVDVVMSNCVINLSPDKRAVYADAFRVLRPGGRIAISDVVALAPMPAHLADDIAARCGCIAGAALASELPALLESVGFTDVAVEIDEGTRELIADWAPGLGYERYVASARIRAMKPADASARTDTSSARTGTSPTGDATPARSCCGPGCCS